MTDLRAGLLALLGAEHEVVDITEPRRLGGGSSQENWAFDATVVDPASGRTTLPLLLRRDPASGVVDTSRDVEFALLAALGRTALPVARVRAVDDGTLLGRPAMVVDRFEGQAHRGVLRENDPLGIGEPARLELARTLAELLAAVHCVDLDGLGLPDVLGPPPADPAASELARWVAELDRVELEPQPALRATVDWLHDHLPSPPERPHLVHGDFRPANVLVLEGRLEALLDWELAHLGDPHDDLGWFTCLVYRREHFVPERWDVDDFLAAWSAVSGVGVDRGRLHFWQVLSTFRLAVIALAGVRHFVDGATDRPTGPVDRVARLALAEAGLTT
jgi:aminoglycoside phosphotransferase (APT) family kinase protein